MLQQMYGLRDWWPLRVKQRKLPPSFTSDYIKVLRVLSRKHREDDAVEVQKALGVLRHMSLESERAGRGELWIPEPGKRTGHYPKLEDIPYATVRTMLRKNTSSAVRQKAREIIAASAQPFIPLSASPPGTLNAAQQRALLSHILVSVPLVKGRHPVLLGKTVPGGLEMAATESRSIIPIHRMSPEDWKRGFTMRKFSLSEDLTQAIKRRLVAKPRLVNPKLQAPKASIQNVLKRATDTKVKLEPERSYILTAFDRQCYENGFRERVRELKEAAKRRVKRSWRWLAREGYIPALLRGATLGVAELVHTEVGMGPTTVDQVPVRRVGLSKQLEGLPSQSLRQVVKEMETELVREANPIMRKGLEKSLSNIVAELAVRKALV